MSPSIGGQVPRYTGRALAKVPGSAFRDPISADEPLFATAPSDFSRQAARLVAGLRVVVDAALRPGVVLPPLDQVDDALLDLWRDRASGEQVFCAIDLRRFAQNRRANLDTREVPKETLPDCPKAGV